ncbi:beta-ketoacyl-[acyl-carrier-protein] synthase family protein [Microbacterium sp. SL62]|uniref:beta-ketoacyl-[acyl-carrier-protein] synthase family protein n=1 Tax=Microbacterium sp. SL62 TaxID=2995139 RepID=UPI002274AC1D|nr:beta-ketoacyl-[acyl-carrier-protein] synthase family protein [Microbacterium sp. SL62]MCY1716448.1 beta-ketoacyl-[acyl-carrier-protein] synthase family protein [Microbacterium sp. SL62]
MTVVAITGLGACTPLGSSMGSSWANLLAGVSGLQPLAAELRARFSLPDVAVAHSTHDESRVVSRRARRMDRATLLGVASAREAWEHAGCPEVRSERIAVIVGSGFGGLTTTLQTVESFHLAEQRHRVHPRAIPMLMPNAIAAAIAIDRAARGPAMTVASACASGTEALAAAFDLVRLDRADVVIVCGTEAGIHPATIAGFAAMNALSVGASLSRASAPFARDRAGLVLGEGAATIILESEAHARARNATVYSHILGAGVTGDAHSVVAPAPTGEGALRAMEEALAVGGVEPADVAHVNAHATGTPIGDLVEYRALRGLFGADADAIPLSATKASTGHLLGATGVLEAAFVVLTLWTRLVPPTITSTVARDPDLPVNVAPEPRPLASHSRYALTNSFGFGGHNASVLIGASR